MPKRTGLTNVFGYKSYRNPQSDNTQVHTSFVRHFTRDKRYHHSYVSEQD